MKQSQILLYHTGSTDSCCEKKKMRVICPHFLFQKNKNLCPAIPTSNEQWHGKTHLVSQNPYSVSKSYCTSFSVTFFFFMLHICTACFLKDFYMMLPNHLSLSLSFLFLPSEPADDLHIWTGPMFVIAGRYQMVSKYVW